MKKMVSILAAAMLLLTGCKDSSSVTEINLTDAPLQTESSASETETTVSSSAETTKTTVSTTGSTENSGAVTGSSAQQSSVPAVTTAAQGNQQQSGTTVTTAQKTVKKLRTELASLKAKGTAYGIIDAGNGRALVACTNSGSVSTAYLIDSAADRQIISVRLKNSYEQLLGVTPDDQLITSYCYSDTETEAYTDLIFYSLSDGSSRKVTCDFTTYVSLQYDRETDTIYGIFDKTLYKIGKDGSATKIRTAGQNSSYISVFLPERGIAYESEIYRNDGSGVEMAAYDTGSGSRLYGFANYYTNVLPLGGRLLCVEGTYDDVKQKSVVNAYVRDAGTGEELRRFKFYEGQHEYFTSPYSDEAVLVKWNEKTWHPSELILSRPLSGQSVKSGITLKSTVTAAYVCYLKELGLWAAAVTDGSYSKAVTQLSLIDPEQADFSKSFAKPYAYGAAMGKELDKKYESLHEITDRIERKTGVRVRIGNEVLQADEPSGYKFVPWEDNSYNDDVYSCREVLQSLEGKLDLYPAGFFDKFREPTTNGNPRVGLRILIVSSLITTTPGSTFTAGGVAYEGSAWYNIAIANNMLWDNDQSIHHEIWHIVEDLLNNSGNPLNMDNWNACNPNSFTYTNDFNSYYNHPEYENYVFTSTCWDKTPAINRIFFSRDYSTVNGQEDRATLIERTFENPYFYESAVSCRNGLEMVQMYPHLNAKLNVLAEAVRRCFGYVYWEEIARAAG
ncbi:MAG: hypothetical protein J6Z45_02540 [Oscillospiraceae bacterium]|nr:hypothetical protein [Oscillospiraceae bacterium]